MNYIFGIFLCILYIILQILYEKIIINNNIVNVKKYMKDSILLYIGYYILINILRTFNLNEYLILWLKTDSTKEDSNSFSIKSIKTLTNSLTNPLIFTNEPNF